MGKSIVLIGPMGVGKTTIGKKLARKLELPFIDTDHEIVQEHGPINEIFETRGEQTFRAFENAAVAKAIDSVAVVATGGGAVLSFENQKKLKSATVIYLATDGRHMRSRLAPGNRPLLKNGFDDWLRIYNERKPLYEVLADIEIDTSSKTLSSIIAEILEKLGSND
jgi:shikimate kinase